MSALSAYEAEWKAWLTNARRRAKAVREGKLTARVAEKRNAQQREAVSKLYDAWWRETVGDVDARPMPIK